MVPEETPEDETEPTAAPARTPATATEGDTPKRHRLRRTRGVIAWILLVLASLLIPIAVISGWAITTVTNTDQYVATMAPLARNDVIVQHLATKATDALFSTHTAQNKIESALPEKAKPIVQPITNQVKSYVHDFALKVFQSPHFGSLWDRLNRRTHSTVVDILTGKPNALEKAQSGGAVVLNLSPKLNDLIDKLNSHGVTIFNPLKAILAKEQGLSLTLVSRDQVSKFSGLSSPHVAQRIVAWSRRASSSRSTSFARPAFLACTQTPTGVACTVGRCRPRISPPSPAFPRAARSGSACPTLGQPARSVHSVPAGLMIPRRVTGHGAPRRRRQPPRPPGHSSPAAPRSPGAFARRSPRSAARAGMGSPPSP